MDVNHEFELKDFVNHVHLFGFMAGYEKRVYKDEDPVNIAAAELMGKLHDRPSLYPLFAMRSLRARNVHHLL